MAFIHDDFLLNNEPARRLYREYAAGEPILDYHNHLPPAEIAGNRQFANLGEIWLEGDHYKWRAMRANGEAEPVITGGADAKDKFLAWARTVPHTLGNPLYHWTHLELSRHFGIDTLLNEETAEEIWETANAKLAQPELSVHGILKQFDVRALCTTDDPTESLDQHKAIAALGINTKVYPTFRPDKAWSVDQPELFNAWADKLAGAADGDTSTLAGFLAALEKRVEDFHAIGSRLSDHSFPYAYANFPGDAKAAAIFDKTRAGTAATPEEQEQFGAHVMEHLGKLYAAKGWAMQLHIGPMRNNNTRLFQTIGPDIGCDSIGDWQQAAPLSAFLDRLDQDNTLPKTILYNNNPMDNLTFATMIGNFQGGTPGKMQFGSGWWHADQQEGMEWQMKALANTGLLSRFIGMLTDSRSFLSFPRHEYFRRTLCNLIGEFMHDGKLPDDYDLVGNMVKRISYQNAKEYLDLVVAD
ncbi:MAG: glucuronate isomerase [Verrucomicrobiales bacterium]|nr:glucuronate isomerase [Verrucomicrobiales bacterium]